MGLRNGTGAGADSSGLAGHHPVVNNDNDLGRIVESL
jgi:hypothetical protein